MDYFSNHPHIPSYYVAGVFSHISQTWVGDFIATSEELFEFGSNLNIDDAQAECIGMMIESQQVYEEWWIRTKRKNNLK